MNPYDFVPLDMQHPPEQRTPLWHNTLTSDGDKLYSGHLYLYIRAETPIFIPNDGLSMQNPDKAGEHMYDGSGNYIIPGSSIKGMLRTVVETLCRGCLTVIKQDRSAVPAEFLPCDKNTLLCTACRLFGMMPREKNARVFLGKVNIGDAIAYDRNPTYHTPIYTAILEAPKPHHTAFYLNPDDLIAGRKFYFHNSQLLTEKRLIPTSDGDSYRNQYIQPLAVGTDFSAHIDFTNLLADEFAALLFAIQPRSDIRHKIGYGKPLGLGSVQLEVTNLQLVDYTHRYKDIHSGRGISPYNGQALKDLLKEQMVSIDPQISDAWNTFKLLPSLNELHRIWQWPPDRTVRYAYPSKSWFDTHKQAGIMETRDT